MSTVTTWQTLSQGPAETEQIAAQVARSLRGGEVIELKSDLGGGKTTFVRGIMTGLESPDHVSSPTFMISKEYNSSNFRVVHFDFYRLHDAGSIAESLREATLDAKSICLVEWGDIVEDILPAHRTVVTLKRTSTDELQRQIIIKTPDRYLLEKLEA